MRQRREIAARPQRPARRHHRQHAGREHVDEELHELAAHAGRALRQRVRAEQHRRPHDLVREGVADAARVAAHEVQLELGRLPRVDVHVDEPAEAGVHSVGRPLVADDALDQRAGLVDLAQRLGRERDREAAQRDSLDVVDGQVVPGELDRRHVRRRRLPVSAPELASRPRSRGCGRAPSRAGAGPPPRPPPPPRPASARRARRPRPPRRARRPGARPRGRPGEAGSRRRRSGSSRPARGRCVPVAARAPARPAGRRRGP